MANMIMEELEQILCKEIPPMDIPPTLAQTDSTRDQQLPQPPLPAISDPEAQGSHISHATRLLRDVPHLHIEHFASKTLTSPLGLDWMHELHGHVIHSSYRYRINADFRFTYHTRNAYTAFKDPKVILWLAAVGLEDFAALLSRQRDLPKIIKFIDNYKPASRQTTVINLAQIELQQVVFSREVVQ